MKILKFALLSLFIAAPFAQATPNARLKTVNAVDLERYAGTWYEIARKSYLFEAGCVCSRQVLTPRADGRVDVHNTCNFWTPSGPVMTVNGVADVTEKTTNAKLTVDFNLPWKGDYWIIGLDQDYRYAVVTDRNERTLFVLSRTPTLEPELYAKAVAEAHQKTNATTSLRMTRQEGCSYP